MIDINDSLILNCSSITRNNGSFIYKWKKDGNILFKNATSFISIKSITGEDAGKYECVLMDGNETSTPCYASVFVNGMYTKMSVLSMRKL